MTTAIYYEQATGRAYQVLTGPDLGGFPEAHPGSLALLLAGPVSLPGYVEGTTYVPLPPSPSAAFQFNWGTKEWEDPRTLADLKAAKWEQVKAERDRIEFGLFDWNGHIFDGDENAQRRLLVAYNGAKEAIALGEPFSTFWKLADNTVITLSAQDVIEVYRRLGEHNIRDNHAAAAVKYAQIQAATTKEELDAL